MSKGINSFKLKLLTKLSVFFDAFLMNFLEFFKLHARFELNLNLFCYFKESRHFISLHLKVAFKMLRSFHI